MKKKIFSPEYPNGALIDMTPEEITQANLDLKNWNDNSFNRAIKNLREKRNQLLAETDYFGNSDVTMSDDMTTYRQNLRDITNGLTTEADVDAVVFPTKPSE